MKRINLVYLIDKKGLLFLAGNGYGDKNELTTFGGAQEWWKTSKQSLRDHLWRQSGGVESRRLDLRGSAGIRVDKKDLEFFGHLKFSENLGGRITAIREVCAYKCFNFKGTFVETNEMRNPNWYSLYGDSLKKAQINKEQVTFIEALKLGKPVQEKLIKNVDEKSSYFDVWDQWKELFGLPT